MKEEKAPPLLQISSKALGSLSSLLIPLWVINRLTAACNLQQREGPASRKPQVGREQNRKVAHTVQDKLLPHYHFALRPALFAITNKERLCAKVLCVHVAWGQWGTLVT